MERQDIIVRWAATGDWNAAVRLVWDTFLENEGRECTQEGIDCFHEFLFDGRLYTSFLIGRYRMLVAVSDNRIVGVGTLRNENLLSLLFVDEKYQGCGIGTRLVETLTQYLTEFQRQTKIYVMAAPGAVNFYKKLGFVQVAPEKEEKGIRTTDMEKDLLI